MGPEAPVHDDLHTQGAEMISLVSASYLATQTWAWNKNPEPNVVEYRLYWANPYGVTQGWSACSMVRIPASTCDATICHGDPATMPTRGFILFVVTAVDTSGNESTTEHGKTRVCP